MILDGMGTQFLDTLEISLELVGIVISIASIVWATRIHLRVTNSGE
jgi:hypothetical protein